MADCRNDLHHAEMVRAFGLVEDPSHWKGPVDGNVYAADLDTVCEAVSYFTATVAKVTPGPAEGIFHVSAAGYWAGPAAG